MRVSKIEWFYISKETKGQCGSPIRFLNNFIQFSVQYITTIRTSRSQMFFEIGVLRVCNIYRSTPLLESLFSKVASLETYKFVKKRLQHRCFPVIIANFARKFYLKNTTSDCFCTWNSPRIWLHKSGNCWLYFQYKTCFNIKHVFNIIQYNTYIFNTIYVSLLCISSFFFIFFASVLLKLLKTC